MKYYNEKFWGRGTQVLGNLFIHEYKKLRGGRGLCLGWAFHDKTTKKIFAEIVLIMVKRSEDIEALVAELEHYNVNNAVAKLLNDRRLGYLASPMIDKIGCHYHDKS